MKACGRIVEHLIPAVRRRPGHRRQPYRQTPQHVNDRHQPEPGRYQRDPLLAVHEETPEERDARQEGGKRVADRSPWRVDGLLGDDEEADIEEGLSRGVHESREVDRHCLQGEQTPITEHDNFFTAKRARGWCGSHTFIPVQDDGWCTGISSAPL